MIGKKMRRLTGLFAALVLFACAIIPTTAFGATTVTDATAMGDTYYKTELGLSNPSLILTKYQTGTNGKVDTNSPIEGVEFKYVKVGGLYQVKDGSNTVMAYGITKDFGEAIEFTDQSPDYIYDDNGTTYWLFKDGDKIQKQTNDATAASLNEGSSGFLKNVQSVPTDEYGKVKCTLDTTNSWGLYLVVETSVANAVAPGTDGQPDTPLSITQIQTPFLIAVPTLSADGKTWDATIEAQIKNATDEATVEKKIITDDDGTSKTLNNLDNLDDTDTTSIGDTVWYRLKSTVPAVPAGGQTIKTYVLSDVISKGLSVKSDSFQVVMWDGNNETPLNGDPNDGTTVDYTLALNAGITDSAEKAFEDGSSFTITFTDDGLAKLDTLAQSGAAVRDVYVRYSATVNAGAVIGPQRQDATANSGNPNEVKLTYQVDGSAKMDTEFDRVTHFTFGIDVTKQLQDVTGTSNLFAKVKFKVYTKDAGGTKTYYTFTGSDGAYNKPVVATGGAEAAIELSPNNSGNIKIDGLELGTYYLEETATADGYRLLNAPVEFVLNAENVNQNNFVGTDNQYLGTLDDGSDTDGRLSATVVNTKGFSLPSTGESGTLVFVLLGAAVITAGGLFLARTSKANKK